MSTKAQKAGKKRFTKQPKETPIPSQNPGLVVQSPSPWYKENPFWGGLSGFFAFIFAGLEFGLNGYPTLGRLLLWLAWPWGTMTVYCALKNLIRSRRIRISGMIAVGILIAVAITLPDRFTIRISSKKLLPSISGISHSNPLPPEAPPTITGEAKPEKVEKPPQPPSAAGKKPELPSDQAPERIGIEMKGSGVRDNTFGRVEIHGADKGIVIKDGAHSNKFGTVLTYVNGDLLSEWKTMLTRDAGDPGKIALDIRWMREKLEPRWASEQPGVAKKHKEQTEDVERRILAVASDREALLRLLPRISERK